MLPTSDEKIKIFLNSRPVGCFAGYKNMEYFSFEDSYGYLTDRSPATTQKCLNECYKKNYKYAALST